MRDIIRGWLLNLRYYVFVGIRIRNWKTCSACHPDKSQKCNDECQQRPFFSTRKNSIRRNCAICTTNNGGHNKPNDRIDGVRIVKWLHWAHLIVAITATGHCAPITSVTMFPALQCLPLKNHIVVIITSFTIYKNTN